LLTPPPPSPKKSMVKMCSSHWCYDTDFFPMLSSLVPPSPPPSSL
jgi:hypothetical protein